ncbi:MAG TPA: HupE/UreJ family protein, partial [Xanthomonadales bacterium]|nr:HupE/UreJ family protein [Xanthomonadales bacterium]
VAFAFGLLHGLGFASVLNRTGLPPANLPLALLFFNVGVEIGQLGFVLLSVLLDRAISSLRIRWPLWAKLAPGYAVGIVGAFWTFQRAFLLA